MLPDKKEDHNTTKSKKESPPELNLLLKGQGKARYTQNGRWQGGIITEEIVGKERWFSAISRSGELVRFESKAGQKGEGKLIDQLLLQKDINNTSWGLIEKEAKTIKTTPRAQHSLMPLVVAGLIMLIATLLLSGCIATLLLKAEMNFSDLMTLCILLISSGTGLIMSSRTMIRELKLKENFLTLKEKKAKEHKTKEQAQENQTKAGNSPEIKPVALKQINLSHEEQRLIEECARKLQKQQQLARNSRETRAIYETSEALQNWLPEVVNNWQQLDPEKRQQTELEEVLESLLTEEKDQEEQARREWQSTRNFLQSRRSNEADLSRNRSKSEELESIILAPRQETKPGTKQEREEAKKEKTGK